MGVMQNKVTRRAAIAAGAIGLAGIPLVIRSLRETYETDIPSVPQSFAPTRVTSTSSMIVDGLQIKVPPVTMDIEKPGDWEKYDALCQKVARETLVNDPQYKAHLERQKAAEKERMAREAKERSLHSAAQSLEPVEAAIERFNAKIDKDDTIDAVNKELTKKAFEKAWRKNYEMLRAKLGKS